MKCNFGHQIRLEVYSYIGGCLQDQIAGKHTSRAGEQEHSKHDGEVATLQWGKVPTIRLRKNAQAEQWNKSTANMTENWVGTAAKP